MMGKKEAKKKSAEVVTGTFSIHSTSGDVRTPKVKFSA